LRPSWSIIFDMDNVHSDVARRACQLLGIEGLAARLDVSRSAVQAWLAGTVTPPPRAFRKMLSFLRKTDPAYRPVTPRV
jgi:DNA-binding transcriptional regulator YiaG